MLRTMEEISARICNADAATIASLEDCIFEAFSKWYSENRDKVETGYLSLNSYHWDYVNSKWEKLCIANSRRVK